MAYISEEVQFSGVPSQSKNHVRVWSKNGEWDILTVPGGYLYTRWVRLRDSTNAATTTFVPKI